MRTLVLGGTGFVGRRLVELLHDAGNEVAVLNRGVTPVTLPPAVERLIADRTDLEAMSAIVRHREWDAVFDVSGVVQVAGGASLAEHAALFDGHTARYVFVSSQSVYRMSGAFPWHEESPTLDADLATYGGFKVAAEQALLHRNAATGFPVSIARPAAIYGPHNNIFDMEAAMFRRLLDNRPILLPYDGLVVVSYGHVDDLCAALCAMATEEQAVGEVFNVTTGAVTSAAYVDTLAAVTQTPADVVPVPTDIARAAERPLFSRLFTPAHHGMLDIAKLTEVLGVEPAFDLAAGHADTLDWLRKTGALSTSSEQADPLWGRSFDFDYEAALAAQLRPAADPRRAERTDGR